MSLKYQNLAIMEVFGKKLENFSRISVLLLYKFCKIDEIFVKIDENQNFNTKYVNLTGFMPKKVDFNRFRGADLNFSFVVAQHRLTSRIFSCNLW